MNFLSFYINICQLKMARKRSISALLSKGSKKNPQKIKIICNCDKCNRLLVNLWTEFLHRYQKTKTKNSTDQEFTIRHRTKNISLNRIITLSNNQQNSISNNTSIENEESESKVDNNEFNNSSDDMFENYSAPDYEVPLHSNEFADSRFIWILIWIINFRIRFNLPDTVTEALIKFMKLVLIKISNNKFELFCGSLYMAKKLLGLLNQFVNFVVYQKYYKLYKKIIYRIFKKAIDYW